MEVNMKLNTNLPVTVLARADGIKTAYRKLLEYKSLDIICLSQQYDAVLGGFFTGEYAPILYGPGIKTREILPNTPENQSAIQKYDTQHQVKVMTLEKGSESDLVITSECAALISFDRKNSFAILIQDQNLISNFQAQFNLLWEKLSK
jgi:hypothetical protein